MRQWSSQHGVWYSKCSINVNYCLTHTSSQDRLTQYTFQNEIQFRQNSNSFHLVKFTPTTPMCCNFNSLFLRIFSHVVLQIEKHFERSILTQLSSSVYSGLCSNIFPEPAFLTTPPKITSLACFLLNSFGITCLYFSSQPLLYLELY